MNKPFLIGLVLIILVLTVFGVFVIKPKLASEKSESTSAGNLDSTAIPQKEATTGSRPTTADVVYNKFTTADKKLTFEYPSDWPMYEVKNIESLLPQDFITEFGVSIPATFNDPYGGRITFANMSWDKSKSVDILMDSIKVEMEKIGTTYDETKRQTVNGALIVDSDLKIGNVTLKNRDIFYTIAGSPKNTIYNLAFTAPEGLWQTYQPVFNHIQENAKLSK